MRRHLLSAMSIWDLPCTLILSYKNLVSFDALLLNIFFLFKLPSKTADQYKLSRITRNIKMSRNNITNSTNKFKEIHN